jgi:hypothetical protein
MISYNFYPRRINTFQDENLRSTVYMSYTEAPKSKFLSHKRCMTDNHILYLRIIRINEYIADTQFAKMHDR